MKNLFRKEAIDHQRAKLWGDVIILQPSSHYIILAAFLFVFVIAALFLTSQSYSRKESVQGYLNPAAGMARVYAERGGRVSRLYVTTNQYVAKGEKLAEISLDRRFTSGALGTVELEASIRRDLLGVDTSTALLKEKYVGEIAAVEARILLQENMAISLGSERSIVKERVALAVSRYETMETLATEGNAPQATVKDRLETLLQLRQLGSSLDRQISALEQEILNSKMLATMTLPFNQREENLQWQQRKELLLRQLAETQLASSYSLTAPVSGYVSSIMVTEGATSVPSLPVVIMRPENSKLIAKILVPSRAAGLIAAGQDVRIQYDAFPYQRFGVFKGVVHKVSQGILTPNEIQAPIVMQEAFYLVEVQLAKQSITVAGHSVLLKPGMLLIADIELETRSLLEWVFEPILSLKGKL